MPSQPLPGSREELSALLAAQHYSTYGAPRREGVRLSPYSEEEIAWTIIDSMGRPERHPTLGVAEADVVVSREEAEFYFKRLGRPVTAYKSKTGETEYSVSPKDFEKYRRRASLVLSREERLRGKKVERVEYALNEDTIKEIKAAFPQTWPKLEGRVKEGHYGLFKIPLSEREKRIISGKAGIDFVEYKTVAEYLLVPRLLGFEPLGDRASKAGRKQMKELEKANKRLSERLGRVKKTVTTLRKSARKVGFYRDNVELFGPFSDEKMWIDEGVTPTSMGGRRYVPREAFEARLKELVKSAGSTDSSGPSPPPQVKKSNPGPPPKATKVIRRKVVKGSPKNDA